MIHSRASRFLGGLAVSFLVGSIAGAVTGILALGLGATFSSISTSLHASDVPLSQAFMAVLLAGGMTGAVVGAVLLPVCYLTPLRHGFRRAFLPGTVFSIVAGGAGSALDPHLGVLSAIAGFFLGFLLVAQEPDAFRPDS